MARLKAISPVSEPDPAYIGQRFNMERWEPGAILAARKALGGSPSRRGLLGFLTRDRDTRQTFVGMAYDQWQAETGGSGRIIEFIKWIIENPEKIAALIKLIQGLFPLLLMYIGSTAMRLVALILAVGLIANSASACPVGAPPLQAQVQYAQPDCGCYAPQQVPVQRTVTEYVPVQRQVTEYVPAPQQQQAQCSPQFAPQFAPQFVPQPVFAPAAYTPSYTVAFAAPRIYSPRVFAPQPVFAAKVFAARPARAQVFTPKVFAPLRNLIKGRRAEAAGLPAAAIIQ